MLTLYWIGLLLTTKGILTTHNKNGDFGRFRQFSNGAKLPRADLQTRTQ